MSYETQGDPAWAKFSSNLVSLFDPKVAAEGATLRSKNLAYDASAKHDLAKAAAVSDQNAALEEAALIRAGYSPAEAAAIRAARPSSVADIMLGRNRYFGGEMLRTPGADPRAALGLLDQGTAAYRTDFAPTDARQNQLLALENAAALERAKVGADQRAERPLVLSPGSVAVDPATGSQIAVGAPRTSTVNPITQTGTALNNQRLIADAVIANLGGVKKSGKPTTLDFDGKQLPLDPAQLSAITNRVAGTYDPVNDPDITDDIAAAFEAEGLDMNKREPVRGSGTLTNWMGPIGGVRYQTKPRSTGSAPAAPATAPATTPATAPAAPRTATTAPRTQGQAQGQAQIIVVQSQADIDNAPSGATLEVNGKRYKKP
jgi:hypothetical protein